MSLKTWKEEFYPIEAEYCPEEKALDDSIQKWNGLTRENRDKHELILHGTELYDEKDNKLQIDASSYALCVHHFKEGDINPCETCPIYIVTGDDCIEEYLLFINVKAPSHMINLLDMVKKRLSEE